MQALFVVSLAARGGGVSNTAFQDSCATACFWGGLFLLAIAMYILMKAPPPQEAPIGHSPVKTTRP